MRSGGTGPRAAAGVGLWFAGNGAIYAALLPWYPLLVDRLGLSSWQFGLVVACFAAGSLLSSALPAALIARFGADRVVIGGTVMLGLAAAATAWSVNGVIMAICLLLLGCCDAIVDVAQNVVGITVQDRLGRTILSSMHALWSLGGLLSGAAATAAASSGADTRVWLAAMAVAAVVLTLIGRRLIGDAASPRRVADADSGQTGGPRTAQRPSALTARVHGGRSGSSSSRRCRWRSSRSAGRPSRTSRTTGRGWPPSISQTCRPPRRGSHSASSSALSASAASLGTCS
ncbi:MFS transporter [Brevibacterium oceani]|uniref:MFS transporter n=1 Tax=Brevibacterium oceani TaxID=358099 RepID=UPI001C62F7D1|nr:MFS transporter [Brevibacterium oceani]